MKDVKRAGAFFDKDRDSGLSSKGLIGVSKVDSKGEGDRDSDTCI